MQLSIEDPDFKLSEVDKGKQVRNQLSVYDSLLDVRIRSQRLLQKANSLPSGYDGLLSFFSDNHSKTRDESKSELASLIDSLMEQKSLMIKHNLEDSPALTSIAGKYERLGEKRKLSQRSLKTDYLNNAWQDNQKLDDLNKQFQEDTVNKWQRKVQISGSASLMAKKLKALNQPIVSQISQMMSSDTDRLLKRTRLNRHDAKSLFSDLKHAKQKDDHEDSPKEPVVEIFDDHDFYAQLLKEVIQSKSGDPDSIGSQDPMLVAGQQWAKLRQLQRSTRQHGQGAYERRASKGRKVRYQVHEKLMAFTAPDNAGTGWHDQMIDDFCKSLKVIHQESK